jgi:hypothetical protein
MMGQRLIFVFGQLLFTLFLLAPAAGMAILVLAATQWLVGLAAAAILATGIALAIIVGEVWCGVWWLGQRFEKLDLSLELRDA